MTDEHFPNVFGPLSSHRFLLGIDPVKFPEPKVDMRPNMGTDEVCRLFKEFQERARDLPDPLQEQVRLLGKKLDEDLADAGREKIPYGEFLDRDVVVALMNRLYERRWENVFEDGVYKLKVTATPRENVRLHVDPEKVVAIKNEEGESIGMVVSEGAFTILEWVR